MLPKYGFIAPDDGGPDVFLHLAKVMEANLPRLKPGTGLFYSIEQQDAKISAKDISLVPVARNNSTAAAEPTADEFEKEWGLRRV